jgi:hypothetical protein
MPEAQGSPNLYQLNVLKEKAFTASAYPKGIERLTTLSYPQPNEDHSQSSYDEEDEVSSSGSDHNDSGSSSDEEYSQTDYDSESDSDFSCDDPKSKKRSKAKAKAKSKYVTSKKSNNPKKCKAKQSNKKSNYKSKSKKTTKKLEATVALDLGKTAEEGDLYWQRVSNDPEPCKLWVDPPLDSPADPDINYSDYDSD